MTGTSESAPPLHPLYLTFPSRFDVFLAGLTLFPVRPGSKIPSALPRSQAARSSGKSIGLGNVLRPLWYGVSFDPQIPCDGGYVLSECGARGFGNGV